MVKVSNSDSRQVYLTDIMVYVEAHYSNIVFHKSPLENGFNHFGFFKCLLVFYGSFLKLAATVTVFEKVFLKNFSVNS